MRTNYHFNYGQWTIDIELIDLKRHYGLNHPDCHPACSITLDGTYISVTGTLYDYRDGFCVYNKPWALTSKLESIIYHKCKKLLGQFVVFNNSNK